MTISSVRIGSRGMVRRFAAGATLISLSLLAGCVAQPTASSESASRDPVVNAPVTTTGTRDHVTQSDETDASRRARVRLELAGAYFGRGQMTTALDEVKKSIAADPNVSAAFNLRGLIYGSLGDHRLAEESFRQALRIDPRDADSMQNFGWYLCQQARFGEAHALFLQALAIPQYQDTMSDELEDGDVPYVISTKDAFSARAIATDVDSSKTSDMLGYLRRTISARRNEIEPPQQHEEGIEAVEEARVSPRVRSKDQKYNTIRSMFESKRTAPIIPPNESVSVKYVKILTSI